MSKKEKDWFEKLNTRDKVFVFFAFLTLALTLDAFLYQFIFNHYPSFIVIAGIISLFCLITSQRMD